MIFDDLTNMLWRHVLFLGIDKTELTLFSVPEKSRQMTQNYQSILKNQKILFLENLTVSTESDAIAVTFHSDVLRPLGHILYRTPFSLKSQFFTFLTA